MVTKLQLAALLALLALSPLANAASATVTAVHATEGDGDRSYDERSRPFEELLEGLPYKDFKTVSSTKVEIATGVQVRINERYALSMAKAEKESDGHVKTTIRVLGLPKNSTEPVEVLEMEVRLAPDKPVMIRGLRMEQGEVVVFLNLD